MANEDQNGLDKKVADLSVTDAASGDGAAVAKPPASDTTDKELEPAEKSLLQKVIRKGNILRVSPLRRVSLMKFYFISRPGGEQKRFGDPAQRPQEPSVLCQEL